MALSYAEEREANIRRNRQVLLDLGVQKLIPVNEPKEQPRVKSKKRAVDTEEYDEAPPRKTVRAEVLPDTPYSDGRRRSNRISNHASIPDLRRGTPLPLTVKNVVSSSSDSPSKKRKHDP